MSTSFVAIDLETTGLNAERDAIIEIGAVRFSDAEPEAEFASLIRPEVEVPYRVQQLTGLDGDALSQAPGLETVLPALVAFVGDRTVVGHSIQHDLAFLNRYGVLLNHDAIDTFELASILVPEASRYGLTALMALLGIPDAAAQHRALPDAHRHRRLFLALRERARRLGAQRLAWICRLAATVHWPLAQVFQSALSEVSPHEPVAPSEPLDEPGPRLRPATEPREIDADPLEQLIQPGGRLAERLAGFEDRPGQRQMLRLCCAALNNGGQLMVEAGTGTGKSLAYLLPAAAWARANGRPVIVSTHTLTLQDQLLQKDFPLVRSLLGDELQAAVLKGRSNYLCRSRLERLLERTDLELAAVRAIAKILAWEGVTRTGDRAELMLQPDELDAWRLVGAEREGCDPERCRHARAGSCWLQRARRKAEAAHVIIVNHALLISDVLTDNRLLPRYDRLIVDEAHHLEDVATQAFGVAVSEARIRQLVGDLLATGGPLAACATAVHRSELKDDARRAFTQLLVATEQHAHQLASAAGALFARLAHTGEAANGDGRALRLTPAVRATPAWMEVETSWELVRGELVALGRQLEHLQQQVADQVTLDELEAVTAGLAIARRELADLQAGLERILDEPSRQDVHWLAHIAGQLQLCVAPLAVGDILAKSLFDELQTVILTSATLRAGEGFDFLRERLGLGEAEGEVVPSPFEFDKHALLFLPVDMPEPDQPDYQSILDRTLIALAKAIDGRLLVLYTSHRGLRQSHRTISGPLGKAGIAVLGQGIDGGRERLLATFRESEVPCVLLGTRSFWEGIDVPGPALSALVVARLPFDVPTDPVFEARAEMFDSPFLEYSLPLAILRFRQGFGRLIRTRRDRGVVAVLDGRIRRAYGRSFLDALPPCQRYSGSVVQLPDVAARFLAADGQESQSFGQSPTAPCEAQRGRFEAMRGEG